MTPRHTPLPDSHTPLTPAWLTRLHHLTLNWWQARQSAPTPGPVTPDTLFRTWAQLYDAQEGSLAERAAWTALTTADVERRGRRY